MYVYYFSDTPDPGHSKRQMVDESRAEVARKTSAYHMTALSVQAHDDNWTDAEYKGDLWFDVDHKVIAEAIASAHRLVDGLVDLGVDPHHLRYFASGRKGFHVRVPAQIFRPNEHGLKGLNRMYRMMAQNLESLCNVALDMKPYDGRTGGFLRVENKPRPDGRYKVPISFEEFRDMSPELYAQLTQAPREAAIPLIPKGTQAEGLRTLFEWAQKIAKGVVDQARHRSVENKLLESFTGNNLPECIRWIATGLVPVQENVHWNQIAFQVGAYAASAPQSADIAGLFGNVAARHGSSRYPQESDRTGNLAYLQKYAAENGVGFSCGAVKKLLQGNPCSGCVVQQAVLEKIVDTIPVTATSKGYYKDDDLITDFVLAPTQVFKTVTDEGHIEFQGIGATIRSEGATLGNVLLTTTVWGKPDAFGDLLRSVGNCAFWGNPKDLIHIHRLLKAEVTRLGEEKLIAMIVKKVGIQQVPSPDGTTQEWHYVEPGWSLGQNGIHDYCRYNEPKNLANVRAIRLKNLVPASSTFQQPLDTLLAMLSTNHPATVATVVGWCAAVQIKPMLRVVTKRAQFPLLALIGPTGAGKSQTMGVWSVLGGTDQRDGMVNIGRLTGWPLKKILSEYNSLVAVLDEYTPRLMTGYRSRDITNALKSVYCSESASHGFIAAGGVQSADVASTSAVAYISTDSPEELEVKNRTLECWIAGDATETYGRVFNEAFSTLPIHDHLAAVYAATMRFALRKGEEWLPDQIAEVEANMPDFIKARFDRLLVNWTVPVLGLRLLVATIEDMGLAEHPVIAKLRKLEARLMLWLDENRGTIEERAALDSAWETLTLWATMAQLPQGDMARLQPGVHYFREGNKLFLKVHLAIDYLVLYANKTQKVAHFKSPKAAHVAFQHKPWYVGVTGINGQPPEAKFFHFDLNYASDLDASGFIHVSPLME